MYRNQKHAAGACEGAQVATKEPLWDKRNLEGEELKNRTMIGLRPVSRNHDDHAVTRGGLKTAGTPTHTKHG